MEINIQKYKFNQNGKNYVVSTGIVGDKIRITCQENFQLDGPFYSNEFGLNDLRVANYFFGLTQTLEEALSEINKSIERQKVGLKNGPNDTIYFSGYLIIGTDNDVYNLILKRDNNPNKYGIFTPPRSSAAELVLTTNYKVDGERLHNQEVIVGNLQREQTFIEEELNKIIPEISKYRKITMDIEEENALIRERLSILQKRLEQRKYNTIRLKEENANLKNENLNLNKYITNQENIMRNNQIMQTKVKVNAKPNVNHGAAGVSSKFEQPVVRTFLPRHGPKPTTEEYNKGYNYNNVYVDYTTYDNTNNYVEPQYEYVENTYEVPQVVPEPTYVIQPPQPVINYTQNKIITNYSYKNPTYRVYLKTNSAIRTDGKKKNGNDYYKSISKASFLQSDKKNRLSPDKNNIGGTVNQNSNNYTQQLDKTKLLGYGSNNGVNTNNNDYQKPIGSRFPKSNIYEPFLGKKNSKMHSSNNSKTSQDKGDVIGFSSYENEKK